MPCYFVYDAFKSCSLLNLQLEIVWSLISNFTVLSLCAADSLATFCQREMHSSSLALHFHGVSDIEARVGGVDQLVPLDQLLHLLLS